MQGFLWESVWEPFIWEPFHKTAHSREWFALRNLSGPSSSWYLIPVWTGIPCAYICLYFTGLLMVCFLSPTGSWSWISQSKYVWAFIEWKFGDNLLAVGVHSCGFNSSNQQKFRNCNKISFAGPIVVKKITGTLPLKAGNTLTLKAGKFLIKCVLCSKLAVETSILICKHHIVPLLATPFLYFSSYSLAYIIYRLPFITVPWMGTLI